MNRIKKNIKFRVSVFFSRLGLRMAASSSKKRKNTIDKFFSHLIKKLLQPKSPKDDFMRDEIIDADIHFSPSELEQYQNSKTHLSNNS